MAGYDNPVVGKVKAPVAAMVGRISEEDTRSGARCKFIWCGDMRKAQTSEHTKVRVTGVVLVQAEVGCIKVNRGGWEDIKEMGGHVEGFYPKCGRKLRVKEKGADDIVDGT